MTRSRPPKASKSKRKSPKKTKSRSAVTAPTRLVAIALGSNLGPSRRILEGAVAALARCLGPIRVAPLYRTQPVSDLPQPDYLNTVVIGRTTLAAERLLEVLHGIERRFGRQRSAGEPAGAPRTLDLDLLLLGETVRRRRSPLLPHPRLRERRFVLAPLVDLEPDLPLPPDGATPAELLARLSARPWVRRVGRLGAASR
jgi:2-amino-4-hydroxy-6-hydroxymethyldihydropteridine diphosphokinase